MCITTWPESGLIRWPRERPVLANPAILGEQAISANAAWDLIAELLQDERVDFLVEPPQIDSVFPALLRYRMPTGKLVTLDRGYRQFRGLEMDLLASD